MNSRFRILVGLFVVFVPSCRPHFEQIEQINLPHTRFNLRIQCRMSEGNLTGRLTLRYTDTQAVAYFFSPLNQVIARLYANGEDVLLIPGRGKGCWRGGFREMIDYYWGIPLDWRELQALLETGRVPKDFDAVVDIRYVDRGAIKTPMRLCIDRRQTRLLVTIETRTRESDRFPLPPQDRCLHSLSLAQVFGHD